MLQSRREYRCVKCEHRFSLTADLEQRHQMPIPDECPSHNAKPCRGGKFEFVEGTEVCKDYQEVRIQEQIHRLTVGSIPRSITLILQDDLVDASSHVEDKPGTARVPARPKRLIGRGWPELGAA